jgi:uncharacterized membrane protein YhaH (DUF805 family)
MAVIKAPASKAKTPAVKKPATKPAVKAVKKVTAAKKSTKAPKAKTLNTQVPVKENIDMVQNVLSIKAHNEEVKKAKVQKKVAKAPAKVAPKATVVAPIKSVAERNKSKVVKENAQKTAVKKFQLEKEVVEKEPKACCCCCGAKSGLFGAWARAYKNILNFKGRTSRYEYWAYALFNMFFAFFVYTGLGIISENTIAKTGQPCAWCSGFSSFLMFVWLLIAVSLTVRRLHDCGYAAWKGFFRPMVAWCVVMFLLSVASSYMQIGKADISSFVTRSIGLVAIIAFVAIIYYACKISIVSGFYEEEKADNAYGAPMYNDACYKKYGIRYAGLMITGFIIIALIYIGYMTTIAINLLEQLSA